MVTFYHQEIIENAICESETFLMVLRYKNTMSKNSHIPETIEVEQEVVGQISADIYAEIYKAGKIPNIQIIRKLVKVLLRKPVSNFSHFIARLDALIGAYGFVDAARIAIDELSGGYQSSGAERIPSSGPLIVASNHPGTYDGFALIANMQREDFKIMVSGIPFFQNLPNASKYLIYSTRDVQVRMQAMRDSISHLKSGGALLIFPSGRIDPDPAVLPGAESALSLWSRSILVFKKKVPESSLVLAITSGVLSKAFANHPYPRLFRNDHERRRVMEFMQIIKQMVRRKPVSVNPCVSFSLPVTLPENNDRTMENLGEHIHQQALSLLKSHRNAYSLPSF